MKYLTLALSSLLCLLIMPLKAKDAIDYVELMSVLNNRDYTESKDDLESLAYIVLSYKFFVDDSNNYELALKVIESGRGYKKELSEQEIDVLIEQDRVKRQQIVDEKIATYNKEYEYQVSLVYDKKHALEAAKSEYNRCANFTSLHNKSCNYEYKEYGRKNDSYNRTVARYDEYLKEKKIQGKAIDKFVERSNKEHQTYIKKLEQEFRDGPKDYKKDFQEKYQAWEFGDVSDSETILLATDFNSGANRTKVNLKLTKAILELLIEDEYDGAEEALRNL